MTSVIRRADGIDFNPSAEALGRNNAPPQTAPSSKPGNAVTVDQGVRDTLVKPQAKATEKGATETTAKGGTILAGTAGHAATVGQPLVMAPPKPSAGVTSAAEGKTTVLIDGSTARSFTMTSSSGKTTTLGAVADYVNNENAPQTTRDALKQTLGLVDTGTTDASGKTVYAITVGAENDTGSNTGGHGESDSHNTSSSSGTTRSASPETQAATTTKAVLSAQRAMSTATNATLVNLAGLSVAQSISKTASLRSLQGTFTFGALKKAMRSTASTASSATDVSDEGFLAALDSSMNIESLLYLFMAYASDKYDDELRDKMAEWEAADAAETAEENTRSITNAAAGVLSLVPGVGSALSSIASAASSAVTYATTSTDSSKSSTVLMQEVQILIQQWKTVNDLVSNLSKDLNDMAMTSIRNLR